MSSINSTSPFRVEVPTTPITPYKWKGVAATEAQINEGKAWEEQTRLREEAVNRYAKAHPNPVVGQVLVDGEVFATVFSPGGYAIAHAMPGLSEADLSPADRLTEIARAVKGEIIYSDFLPAWGGGTWSSYSIPDDVAATLPKVTARPLGQVLAEAFEQTRIKFATETTTADDLTQIDVNA